MPGTAPSREPTAFVQFSSPVYGIRALAKILLTYQQKYGLRTIAAIIGRWAPETENNTSAYVEAVAGEMGQAPGALIDLSARPELLRSLVAAIIHHENGQQPYSPAMLDHGISLARG